MSYPVLFNLDRGNVESLLFVFLILFINNYRKGNDLASVFFLSLAVSMKLYPGVFIVLFLADKKYRNIFLTGIMTAALTLASAAILEGGILKSFYGLRETLVAFYKAYILTSHGLQHNTSLFGLIRIVSKEPELMTPFVQHYTIAALLIFGVFALYLVFIEKQFWKRVTILICMMLLLPQITYDYKLIHLFIAAKLFLSNSESEKHDLAYAIMFGLLLIPKDYIYLASDISVAVLINPILMLMIAGRIILDSYTAKTDMGLTA